jgi:hypothetical protein
LSVSPPILHAFLLLVAILGGWSRAWAQSDTLPRRLSAKETGCSRDATAPTGPVFEADSVDQPVTPRRLVIDDMPFRAGEVLSGRSIFRFIVEPSGAVDRCSITLVEETAPRWTAAVVRELRHARYQPARRGGTAVRQWVYQTFTYHSDGRIQTRR